MKKTPFNDLPTAPMPAWLAVMCAVVLVLMLAALAMGGWPE